jgi:ABC-type sulfate transport system permease component
MSLSGAQLVVASPSSNWTKIILVAIFALGLLLVILVPFVTDLVNSHRTWRDVVTKDPASLKAIGRPSGVQGLARATMAFAVIVVIGFALGYILVETPFKNNQTIAGNIVVALTTTLAAITAFYFGSKQASDAKSAPPPEEPPANT